MGDMDMQKSSVLPTFVIIPGAWHSPCHYDLLTSRLYSAGYPTLSRRLPGVDPPAPDEITTTTDADFILETLLRPLLDSGKDMILVMHSYGGIPGTAAAVGLSKAERRDAGLGGGIIGIIFVAAFIAKEGESPKSIGGGKHPPWTTTDLTTHFITPENPLPVFYADAPSLASEAIAQLLPHSENCLSTPTAPTAWASPVYNNRRTYIRTLQDRALPVEAQTGMLAGSGVEWDVRDFETGHSPFLSKPDELAATVVGLAEGWMRE
ncbi:hypothetical protein MMC30_008613 [Trapelia coarctata]|nr:hypothetical protein [Trapelia coarctata]